jgi:nucleoside phosphorylase
MKMIRRDHPDFVLARQAFVAWFDSLPIVQRRKYYVEQWLQGHNRSIPLFDLRHVDIPADFSTRLRAVFDHKCVYCEQPITADDLAHVQLFRPPITYEWLRWEGDNFYLSCAGCATAKQMLFPVAHQRAPRGTFGPALRTEQPLLLDPCDTDVNPLDHLYFTKEGYAEVRDDSPVGMATINLLQLNRPELVEQRRAAASDFLLQAARIVTTSRNTAAIDVAINRLLALCADDQPFVGLKRCLLRLLLMEQGKNTQGRWTRLHEAAGQWAPAPPKSISRISQPRTRGARRASADVGIVIALDEEFERLKREVSTFEQVYKNPATGTAFFRFQRNGYRCVVTVLSDMGITLAALRTAELLTHFKLAAVVSLGISGALSSDLLVGDVLFATQVDGYLENSRAANQPSGDGFLLNRAGYTIGTSIALTKVVNILQTNREQAFVAWQQSCAAQLPPLALAAGNSLEAPLVRTQPAIIKGPLASGPIVVASPEFVTWLKTVNRKFAAVDMEAWGVLRAAQEHDAKVETMVIRGISDFADERKSAFDRIGHGALRSYAMDNAVRLLWCLLDAQKIPLRK